MLYCLIVPQPLSQQECFATLVANMRKIVNFIKFQDLQASLQWLENGEGQCKPAIKWLEDNMRHVNHCTLLKTNEKDH